MTHEVVSRTNPAHTETPDPAPPRPLMRHTDFPGDDERTWSLLVRYHRHRRREDRNQVVERLLPLAESLTRRYRDRGEHEDDLRQVAAFALLRAVERFDPDRGIPFASFAVPTIRGELRHHFRDHGWAIRVPRRLQELHLELRGHVDRLTVALDRAPTVDELAEAAGVSTEAVLDALELPNHYRPLSIDVPVASSPTATIADDLDDGDRALARVEARATITRCLGALDPRERAILYLRYFEDKTQSEIADAVGISQMHVSRLIARSLERLAAMSNDDAP